MHPRPLLMLVIGFFGGLTVAACSPAASCTTANCGGCCDASGKCQSGATSETCGVGGASCGRCGAGTVCTSGECRVSSMGGGGGTTGGGGASGGGTGGGSTGGGSGGGTTGGGSGGCRQITRLATDQANLSTAAYIPFTNSVGHYNYAGWVFLTAANPDGFRVEVAYPNDVVPQLTQNFANVGYNACSICGVFYENCAPGAARCGREYLAQSGSVSITRADRATAGRLAGTATSVRFNEWDIDNDRSNGTGCVIVNTVGPWDIWWNADGGVFP